MSGCLISSICRADPALPPKANEIDFWFVMFSDSLIASTCAAQRNRTSKFRWKNGNLARPKENEVFKKYTRWIRFLGMGVWGKLRGKGGHNAEGLPSYLGSPVSCLHIDMAVEGNQSRLHQ